MSEDEKKAYKILKYQKNYVDIKTLFKEIDVILDFVDKEQKENEMLKAITQNYNAIGGETFEDDRIILCSMKYFNDGYFKRNYIWKDKIREKIKEFETESHNLDNEKDLLTAFAKSEYYKDRIKLLKELIGEE